MTAQPVHWTQEIAKLWFGNKDFESVSKVAVFLENVWSGLFFRIFKIKCFSIQRSSNLNERQTYL